MSVGNSVERIHNQLRVDGYRAPNNLHRVTNDIHEYYLAKSKHHMAQVETEVNNILSLATGGMQTRAVINIMMTLPNT